MSAAFIPLVHGQLAELKHISSSMWHKQLRENIAQTETYLQKLNPSTDVIDFDRALEPFFRSIASKKKSDVKLFQPVVLDCFYNVFSQSSREFYPDRDLTQKIINVLICADSFPSDEINLKCCNVCIACLRSASGIHFCHGRLLRRMFKLLFRIYNNSENANTFNSIKTAIHQTLQALFDSYLSSPEIPHCNTVEELSARVVSGIFQNTESIFEYCGTALSDGDYAVTIRDVDVCVVLSLLAKTIESNKLQFRTISLAANFLVSALNFESRFYETNAFRALLQTKIHVAVMALTLDSRSELAQVTAELILVLWQKFASLYIDSLNEVFVKGLGTALTSPDRNTVSRALTVYEHLVKEPRLFVSAFINYDCDDTGHFPNVFSNTVNQIVKISYPDRQQTPVQKQALELIVSLLQYLWKYFDDVHTEGEVEEEQHTAETFLEAKKTKTVLEDGLRIFKKSPKKGLKFLIDHNFIEDTPEAIARYFFGNTALDAAGIGEIIGGSGQQNIQILKHYVSLFDFKGSTFEHAFREFLSSFQIPGEAQMIDRVMEQFGQKFFNDNPTLFSSADTVYVLAYSTLMLHTDAHHPNVKSRMTLEQFITNNRGIDGGNDLPRDFLEDLYNGIRSEKIFSSAGTTLPSAALLTREQRADLFQAQASEALAQARARNEVTHNDREFHKADSPLFLNPMFNAIWGAVLATLTMTFEQSEVPEMYKKCLEGLTYAVHIASHCFIEDALATLIDAFTKFTALKLKKFSEIKQKNIDCCSALMEIALNDGNFLKGAWRMVVDQMSELDNIRLNKLPFQYDIEMSEQLFTKSAQLDRESIVDFCAAMCATSEADLKTSLSRHFMLQQLEIVAHENMSREHVVWDKIWNHIGAHLAFVGSKYPPDTANVAINVLTQTADKFLRVPELTEMHFQANFMAPFVEIFQNHEAAEVKDYVLFSIRGITAKLASSLQSGWEVIFTILSDASNYPECHATGFDVIEFIMERFLDIISPFYVNLFSILTFFISKAEDPIKVKAMEDFSKVAEKAKMDDLDVWVVVFQCLARITLFNNPEVRKRAHQETIAILERAISEPIADQILSEVLRKTLPGYLAGMNSSRPDEFYSQASDFMWAFFANLVDKHYEGTFSRYFDSVMQLLAVAIVSENEQLSETGLKIMKEFLENAHASMNEEQISILLNSLKESTLKIFSLTPKNRKLLIDVASSCVDHFNRMSFVEILETADDVCEKAESEESRFLLWSSVRSALLKALLVKPEETKDKIVECVYRTIDIYEKYGFAYEKKPESSVWSGDVVITFKLLNEMPDDLFNACFDKACQLIADIVPSQSLKVRKTVALTLKRRFK